MKKHLKKYSVPSLQLFTYGARGSEELVMVRKQEMNFFSNIFKHVIKILDRFPSLQLSKNLLTFISIIYTKTLDADALNNAGEFFLNYFLKIIDRTRWRDDVKDSTKDALKHLIPAYIKFVLSKGEGLSTEDKKGLLKSVLRLVWKNFNIGEIDNDLLSLFANKIFSKDQTEVDRKTGLSFLSNVLDSIFRIALNNLPNKEVNQLGEFGLSGCLHTLEYYLCGFRNYVTQLLNSEEHSKDFDGSSKGIIEELN